MSIKANVMSMPTEGKAADIGFISSPNFHTKSNRVKATTAHVPVATESLKPPPAQCNNCNYNLSVVVVIVKLCWSAV